MVRRTDFWFLTLHDFWFLTLHDLLLQSALRHQQAATIQSTPAFLVENPELGLIFPAEKRLLRNPNNAKASKCVSAETSVVSMPVDAQGKVHEVARIAKVS